jgi:hypothetical protein
MIYFKKRLFNLEQGLAFSLFLLMLVALSIKPFHLFFIHHEVIVTHDTETKFAAPNEQDCPICDFEFFLYTAQTEHPLPPAVFSPFHQERLIKTSQAFLVYAASFLLRAPPVTDHLLVI